ncbi:metal-dependent phosphohydrolase [Desulfonema ishimotonii]|uniref:Metal-dependent phosphohydrolase n=1 Tax=Desulfonema ishimotonii TaxID=45657 RepID=A0A401FVH3_9BACT|nr:Npun_R2479 family HD domain-containing metalloprotein [Desulfonema ishimotonii]GBC60958.1 metal-dependent phosphohydrolase [Desulfonema ishimotonii]
MLNVHKLLIDPFAKELVGAYQRAYGFSTPDFANIIEWSAHFALENIANCDALYHDVEHTMMVTLAGQEILRGKHLIEGGVTPADWLHFILALLCHDIGYVRGICRADRDGEYATGRNGQTVRISPDGSCAALAPWHVDRGKCFIRERFSTSLLNRVNAEVVAACIEMTRFPVPDDPAYQNTSGYPGLLRAADFIGQLGDPNYLRKTPALFYEFEENGTNKEIGYRSPGDLRKNFAKFYWNVVTPYIQDALAYLKITQEGKQWISNLHSHVFTIEHDQS